MEPPKLSLDHLIELIKEQNNLINELNTKNRQLEFTLLLQDNKINAIKDQIENLIIKLSN